MNTVAKLCQSIDRPSNTPSLTTAGFPLKGMPFAKINISTMVSLYGIKQGFRRVPPDTYVLDNTRFKDIVRFAVGSGDVTQAPHGELFHPVNAGSYGNDASRTYCEVPSCDINALIPAVDIFARIAKISDGQEILVQRQSVVCSGLLQEAKTVREGAHRDGVQKLGILCVDRVNVEGGISFLYDHEQQLLFAGTLEPGDLLFIDDTAIYHDTTPIRRVSSAQLAYRNILILTYPSDRKK